MKAINVTGIILAGGKSTRLGRNKAVEQVSGKPLIQHVYDNLKTVAGQIIIVSSRELAAISYPEGLEVLVDMYPGKGPLSGIFTGLSAAKYEYSIVVGCDMPFLNSKVLRYLVARAEGCDAAVPKINSQLEPLHAVYSKSCIAAIKEQLEQDKLEIRALFPRINVRYIESDEYLEFDPDMISFVNVNNQADLDKAVCLLKAGGRKK